jgi:apolipoprotein N-acyltransferase
MCVFDMRMHSDYTMSALLGLWCGAAFLYSTFWWLVFPSLILLVYTIEKAETPVNAMTNGILFGVLKALIVTSWYWYSYPLDWLSDSSRLAQFLSIAVCWLGTGISLGLPYAFMGYVIWKNKSSLLTLLLSEVLGAFLFSIYSYGPGGILGFNFGFGMTGFLLADHSLLLLLASYGGVYILTTLIGAIAYTLYYIFTRSMLGGGIVFGLLLVTSFPDSTATHALSTPVAAVGTNFPPYRAMNDNELAYRQSVLEDGIKSALLAGAHVILLPEDARFGYGRDASSTLGMLSNITRGTDAIIIDSYRTEQNGGQAALQRSYTYDMGAKRVYINDKHVLVPGGEYVPYIFFPIIKLFSADRALTHMTYVPGTEDTQGPIPVLFCFESSATPRLAHFDKNAPIIAHPVSHAWFKNPHTLWNQERQILKVQSRFLSTPILQAGNMAPSVLYTPDGKNRDGTRIYRAEDMEVRIF